MTLSTTQTVTLCSSHNLHQNITGYPRLNELSLIHLREFCDAYLSFTLTLK